MTGVRLRCWSTGYGNGKSGGLLEFVDTPEAEFDAAINEAKSEGNLSRANVARKIIGDDEGAWIGHVTWSAGPGQNGLDPFSIDQLRETRQD